MPEYQKFGTAQFRETDIPPLGIAKFDFEYTWPQNLDDGSDLPGAKP